MSARKTEKAGVEMSTSQEVKNRIQSLAQTIHTYTLHICWHTVRATYCILLFIEAVGARERGYGLSQNVNLTQT